MKLLNDEKGGTFALVLLLSIIMSLIVISLLAMFGQSHLVSAQAGSQERAYADADSAIRILKRSIKEVYAQANGISAEGVEKLIDELIRQQPLEYNHLTGNTFNLELIGNSKLRATAEYGHGKAKRSRTIELSFTPLPITDDDIPPGGGSGGNGYGQGAGGTSQVGPNHPIYPVLETSFVSITLADNKGNDVFFSCQDDLSPNREEKVEMTHPEEIDDLIDDYNVVFEQFVTEMLDQRPPFIPPIPTDATNHTNTTIGNNSPSHLVLEGVDGEYAVPGNFTVNWGNSIQTLTVNGDFIINGNLNAYQFDSLIVNGDLIVGGSIDVNQVKNIIVRGTLSVGGAAGSAGNFTINNGLEQLVVGEWHGDAIVSAKSFLVKGTFNFSGGIQSLKVSGDMSIHNMSVNSIVNRLHVGGSIISNNGWRTLNNPDKWLIEKHISVHSGQLNLQSMQHFEVRGSIYVNGNFYINGLIELFLIEGSVYMANDAEIATSMNNILVRGDFLANGNITFRSPLGSTSTIEIDEFHVGGAFGARHNILFSSSIFTLTSFGGFYAGNDTTFTGSVIGKDDQGLCINYNPPGSGGSGEFEFGDIIIN